MITRLLVANRAEIASRVFATCRRLGVSTVAVHSDADAALPYVGEADVAVRLPGAAPAETYLRVDLLLEAARASGADAVHPGYGFLSESADFARAVLDAGLTWVGPDPSSIEQMGSKIESKRLMEAAGVPVLRNHSVDDASEADLPLLVKASAGGGGRGMRVVRDLADLPGEVERARAEAQSAFGDGTVFVETYVERGRHVEVQVVGHRDGVLVLGERDCSVQRRHQKVVEESPAPGLPDAVRAALHEAARAAAAAIDYRGAGTVEFLYDPATERFFFLEMNTRLQVEHPVTELVHGVDLVDLQLTVAEGGVPDPRAIGETYGHAVEVRLYAEDPAADYQPQSGPLSVLEVPGVDARFDLLNRPGVRLDAGFAGGSEVSTHYDAMLAKVIAWAPTREQAVRRLADTLARTRVHGVVTNRDLLVQVLRSPDFVAGDLSTAFLADHPALAPAADPGAPVAAALALAEHARAARRVQGRIPVAWRSVVSQPQRTELDHAGEPVVVEWWGGRDGYTVEGCTVVAAGPTEVVLERDGLRSSYAVAVSGPSGREVVDVDGPGGHARLVRVPRFVDPAEQVAAGSLLAPMPGTVVSVAVEEGQAVVAGQPVLVLEAMKMQHTVSAPADGTLARITVQPGAQVAAGEVLAVVEGEVA
ncbi:acetyl/propionyl/methylcrotonyl-CoA carboxylase subunit alpha [Nocardioides kribbensis]|uniref:acetyl/propionyl/methylcrotonyl-CoA carboxylase subunit alpha n=1 Tax=Nocardioides kribbensis TaxID=305517 RepID=UPI00187AB46E|nr:biotin carboxylase N-terminal domain-containing protein [Nocardioides kribbensis]